MHTVPSNKDEFTINSLSYCCDALIFTLPLVYEFLCGPKHMATPVKVQESTLPTLFNFARVRAAHQPHVL